jgi:hypothetical protein
MRLISLWPCIDAVPRPARVLRESRGARRAERPRGGRDESTAVISAASKPCVRADGELRLEARQRRRCVEMRPEATQRRRRRAGGRVCGGS